MAQKNSNLRNAKRVKNDEFYTQLTDIEKEMRHYKDFFKGKVVYCNCDDARESNFFKYFSLNFEHLGLKKLITTGYKEDGKGVVLIYEGDKNGNRIVEDSEIIVRELEGNGDFRSAECIEFLKECDVVVTNPPFSLFREYVAQLMEYGKKFLIIGPQNAVTYKEIFPLLKDNKIWWGTDCVRWFIVSEEMGKTTKINYNGETIAEGDRSRWWTNIPHNRRNIELDLFRKYNETDYPKYDNYDAIEVSKVSQIPMDYDGVMGVPITFLYKYCPTQFEIVGITENADYLKPLYLDGCEKYDRPYVNGKRMYSRLLIKKVS
jgi:hypothetical protein